ncbi:cupin domain-containing protein [Ramlibacter sp. WS9]|uniref:cupin domain-containing protein n=1 Tax=Ramlibacter sp. WS9 TaxID=1882741 RepID=UPI001141402B|nr:cupin domain-containing protein [Ramlibacter sp. WS9]ROZ76462.1 cupin domain-containing protein [Ramlibacter sp. WS9]
MSTTADSISHFESARVIVTEWRLPPGAETGHHVHSRDYVVVPLTDGTLRMHDGQGATDVPLCAGAACARPAGVAHNVTNPTHSEFRFVEIELK